jgi:hypothetical protein
MLYNIRKTKLVPESNVLNRVVAFFSVARLLTQKTQKVTLKSSMFRAGRQVTTQYIQRTAGVGIYMVYVGVYIYISKAIKCKCINIYLGTSDRTTDSQNGYQTQEK